MSGMLRGRGNRRNLKIRSAIKKAAEKTILEKGYSKTSIKDIMSETGLGYATFYNHYKSKNDVVMEIVAENIEMARQAVKFAPPEEDNLLVRCYISLYSLMEIFYNSKQMWKIVRAGMKYDKELERIWNDANANFFESMKEEITWSLKWGLCHEGLALNVSLVFLWGSFASIRDYILDNDMTTEDLEQIGLEYSYMWAHSLFKTDTIPANTMVHLKRGKETKIVEVNSVVRESCRRSRREDSNRVSKG
ncbi:MAG: TetR/AcrR family transcriptional regulator [Chitinophagales bacterium]